MVREPGTGTQYHAFATTPDDSDRPNGMSINGTYWKVGHDYLDTEIGDVCTLVEIVGKSSFCDMRDASEQPPKLVFAYERYSGFSGDTIEIDPHTPDRSFEERFIERYTAPPKRGEPSSPYR